MSIKRAKEILLEEAEAISRIASTLGDDFTKVLELIYGISGKVVVIGVGKSGLIARKVAATLSSTGTPSFFLHAADSLHGDVGVIDKNDIALILSYSGNTDEISMMLQALKKLAVPITSITGNSNSVLAANCDASILIPVEKEACPFNLVPTTSTTAMLAVGDAIALTLLEKRGFKAEDFANLHPSGSLGKKLLLKVDDLITKSGANPVVRPETSIKDVLISMTTSRVGAASVVDKDGKLIGYFTDGDLRRQLQKDPHLLEKEVSGVMTKNPTCILSGSLAIEAKEILKNNSFDNLAIIDKEGKPIGIIDERDIIKEGL